MKGLTALRGFFIGLIIIGVLPGCRTAHINYELSKTDVIKRFLLKNVQGLVDENELATFDNDLLFKSISAAVPVDRWGLIDSITAISQSANSFQPPLSSTPTIQIIICRSSVLVGKSGRQ